ncbi:hypothetical protein O9X98_05480 [Agrobacterium salinitolerans]|nr:hypothetical protein [Agrobacterium salinitolerans]
MKTKTTAVEKPLTAIEQLLAKREGFVAERDAHLSKLMELNADIESLDSVIKMFDPNHVPLDIRQAQGAPVLTLTAQPILAEVAEQAAQAAAEAKPAAPKAAAKSAKATKAAAAEPKEAAPVKRKPGRPAKADAAVVAADAEPATATALSEAVSGKVKATKKPKQPKASKKTASAREQVKEYFGDIDKLKTLEDIVKSESDGVPFRVICEKFAERHPIDVSKPDVKKVFSDRLSTLLYGLSQQNVVQRGERQGTDGKQENVWVYTRASRNGNGGGASSGAEASAAL